MELSDYVGDFVVREPSHYKYYVNLTKLGRNSGPLLKGLTVARNMGYYSAYLAASEFQICKECEKCEEVGMGVLYYL